MLRRKITDYIKTWAKNKQQECLLIKGARQIGKTFIVQTYGRSNYKHFIEINFERQPELIKIFEEDLSVDVLTQRISLYIPNAIFIPGQTLLFLDEIQACPQARTSLKFWAIDNRYDVIASGSLLGLNYKEVSSYPVGYERQVEMHSLDFEEFLWAIGIQDGLIANIKEHLNSLEPIDAPTHQRMMSLLREYMVVGGMPAVVNCYLEKHNLNLVHEEQTKILDAYLNDIAKYAPNSDKPKARNCFLSIPRQLAKENTKFQYSVVEKGGTARKFGSSLDWLRDANIVRYCHNVSTVMFPLSAYLKSEQYRIYMSDIGLLTAMYHYDLKRALIEDTLQGPAKGGIYENLVADLLSKHGKKLFYYMKDDNSLEIEFILEKDAAPIPTEVKSKKGSTTSLNKILELTHIPMGYKLSAGNIGVDGKKVSLPIYLAAWL